MPGTLYNSQLNILFISDIKINNYFNEESQCLPGTLYNSQLNSLVISDIKKIISINNLNVCKNKGKNI